MILTDGATFPMDMIKLAKTRINQKINLQVTQSDTYRKL